MTRDDIIRMARVVYGDDKEKPFHESALYHLEEFAKLVAAAEREKVAAWMIQRSYATAHGETIEDLLQELEWQILEGWSRALINGVETEREGCAKVLDDLAAKDKLSNYYKHAALMIRERGAP